MRVTLSSKTPAAACDLLAVPAGPQYPDDTLRQLDAGTGGHLLRVLRRRGFRPPAGAPVLYQPPPGAQVPPHILVVPVSGIDAAAWRLDADLAVTHARELRAGTVAIVPSDDATVETAAEALCLAAYAFRGLKSKPDRSADLPRAAVLLRRGSSAARAALQRGCLLAQAAALARDLVNLPADVVTPAHLAAVARRLARQQHLRVRVFGPLQLRRMGMGALLGVARGSAQRPAFIELIYRPRRVRRCVALVGKGITFDSGGLSLKPAESMQTQKRDMAGGAVVLGVMSVLHQLAPPVEVRGYIPATENMPSGAALKPGDVVRAFNRTTIEVLNTDAEGRLVLADGLSFAAAGRPDVMIDCATLTGAVRNALGPRYAALMATDATVARALSAAAEAAGEHLWELPLVDEYRRELDSSVADIKNIGDGQGASTIIGGLFLREFTGKIPWAHIDFSSTVVTDKPFPGHPKGATGFGVRTLLRYILQGAPVSSP